MTYQEYVEAWDKLIAELQSIIEATPPGLKCDIRDPVYQEMSARHHKVSEGMVNLNRVYFGEQDEK